MFDCDCVFVNCFLLCSQELYCMTVTADFKKGVFIMTCSFAVSLICSFEILSLLLVYNSPLILVH